jgi:transcriptional regulator with XRE-family HTH domain
MTDDTGFRSLLKRYRLAAGLSQEALAARASVSARAISDLERGVYQKPRYDTLDLLIGALSLTEQQQILLRAAAYPEPPPIQSRRLSRAAACTEATPFRAPSFLEPAGGAAARGAWRGMCAGSRADTP